MAEECNRSFSQMEIFKKEKVFGAISAKVMENRKR